jgi:hypothetical protein
MVNVPEKFRPHINVAYPEGNDLIFEEWFYQNWNNPGISSEYLPVFWTSLHVNNGYGRDRRLIKELQAFVNSLDKSKQYFTIIQYDSGPLVDLPPNIKVFAMSGPRIDYPLPLICKPHSYPWRAERTIYASFMGRLTHPIRHKMVRQLSGNPGYFIDTKPKATSEFCKILAQSLFALCPRGFGETSFRICEALQYGAIPVYISDEFIIPHNHDFNDYGVLVDASNVSQIPEILSQIPESEVKRKQEAGRKIYNEKFSFQGCKDLILNNLILHSPMTARD